MCLATPVRVKKINGKTAIVSDHHGERQINVVMIKDLKAGDYVLAHADLGIQKLKEKDAKAILGLNKEYHQLEHKQGIAHSH